MIIAISITFSQSALHVASICTLSVCHALCIEENDQNLKGICDSLGSHKQVMPLIHDHLYVKIYNYDYC
jgi:hypothetical protein